MTKEAQAGRGNGQRQRNKSRQTDISKKIRTEKHRGGKTNEAQVRLINKTGGRAKKQEQSISAQKVRN